jgi:hypothetical protein
MASIDSYRTSKGERRFEVRYRDARGRSRSRVFKLRGDAQRFKVEVERRQQLGALYDERPQPFGTFLDGWLRRYEVTVRPATYDRAVQALAHLRGFDALYIRQLSVAAVEDRIAEIAERAPRQAQMALRLLRAYPARQGPGPG